MIGPLMFASVLSFSIRTETWPGAAFALAAAILLGSLAAAWRARGTR
jgi:hypothetical protein